MSTGLQVNNTFPSENHKNLTDMLINFQSMLGADSPQTFHFFKNLVALCILRNKTEEFNSGSEDISEYSIKEMYHFIKVKYTTKYE